MEVLLIIEINAKPVEFAQERKGAKQRSFRRREELFGAGADESGRALEDGDGLGGVHDLRHELRRAAARAQHADAQALGVEALIPFGGMKAGALEAFDPLEIGLHRRVEEAAGGD